MIQIFGTVIISIGLFISMFALGFLVGRSTANIEKWQKVIEFIEELKKERGITPPAKLVILALMERTILAKKNLQKLYTKKIPHEASDMDKTGQKDI